MLFHPQQTYAQRVSPPTRPFSCHFNLVGILVQFKK